jgi:hypothetical protein
MAEGPDAHGEDDCQADEKESASRELVCSLRFVVVHAAQ